MNTRQEEGKDRRKRGETDTSGCKEDGKDGEERKDDGERRKVQSR